MRFKDPLTEVRELNPNAPIFTSLHARSTVLEPSPLLKMEVYLGGQRCQAIIDTGALYSLAKPNLIRNLCIPIEESHKLTIKGLGKSECKTEGSVEL